MSRLVSLFVVLFIAGSVIGCGNKSVGTNNNASPSSQSSEMAAAAASTTLSPANGATNICPDTLLKITFSSAPSLGTSGKIQIFKSSTSSLVDTIDMSSSTQTNIYGNVPGATSTRTCNYYPVIITGNTACIYLHNNKLTYNTQYYLTLDSTVFGGVSFAGIAKGAWQFTTKTSAPAPGFTTLTVAADGSQNFCTVQGAIDCVPVGNTTPITINIYNGNYQELIYLGSNKSNITLKGQDRTNTIIQYKNNNTFNPSNNLLRNVMLVETNGFTLNNLTLTNTTPQGGSQAEAICIHTNAGSNCAIKNCNLISFQDTVYFYGTVWVYNSLIDGDVDFNWGYGPAVYYESCEIRSRSRSTSSVSYNVQSRCANATVYGFVFAGCSLTQESGNTCSYYLARSAQNSAYYDNVVYLNCKLDTHINAAGWYNSPSHNGWHEYKSVKLSDGKTLVDVSKRKYGTQLTDAQAATYTKANVLGGWNPQP